ncbi:hypothetical protein HanIR_Chr12g0569651 [Helianthus annuus]|nr:hypothetical protein HanIR_Chr12g0569651 [Helianthus annuus]
MQTWLLCCFYLKKKKKKKKKKWMMKKKKKKKIYLGNVEAMTLVRVIRFGFVSGDEPLMSHGKKKKKKKKKSPKRGVPPSKWGVRGV